MAHCFGPAGPKRRFCCVCRKQTEGNATALRCEGGTLTRAIYNTDTLKAMMCVNLAEPYQLSPVNHMCVNVCVCFSV